MTVLCAEIAVMPVPFMPEITLRTAAVVPPTVLSGAFCK